MRISEIIGGCAEDRAEAKSVLLPVQSIAHLYVFACAAIGVAGVCFYAVVLA
jgi:hypothetical protein